MGQISKIEMQQEENYALRPAIPAGMTDDNLPVGMQIIGKRYRDVDVLTASSVFGRLKPWQHIYQICQERPLVNPSLYQGVK
jgi:hypothetical protein